MWARISLPRKRRNGQTAPEVISQLALRDEKHLAKVDRLRSVPERSNCERVQGQENLAPLRNHEGYVWQELEHSLERGKGV